MFSDLCGYTALNEALDPEEVEAVMARIKADASAVIERHGGTVNQFVGDEVMALFGVPLAHRDDARAARSRRRSSCTARSTPTSPRSGRRSPARSPCTPASTPAWSSPAAATRAPATTR